MKIIEIDLVKLAKNKLTINEYLTILKIAKSITGEEFPFSSEERHLDSLEENEWIIQSDDDISLTKKAEELIELKLEKTSYNHFDELFNLYPYRTPSGRVLRSRNKSIGSTVTRNYIVSRDRYLKKVKDTELHNKIIESIKKMLSEAKLRGGMDYIQQLETYINQSSWEKYIGEEGSPETNNTKTNIFRL